MKRAPSRKRISCRLYNDARLKGFSLKIENLTDRLNEANSLLKRWSPHHCLTCRHSFSKTGIGCNLAHYNGDSWDCLSWEFAEF